MRMAGVVLVLAGATILYWTIGNVAKTPSSSPTPAPAQNPAASGDSGFGQSGQSSNGLAGGGGRSF